MISNKNIAFDLLLSGARLTEIVDQPINENGLISVNYQYACELINEMNMCILQAIDELGLGVEDN